jgi:hypothetical protein
VDRFRRILILAAVTGSLTALACGLHRSRSTACSVLVPAYFYPGKDNLASWKEMARAARSVPVKVILNPASGPGAAVDPNYRAVLRRLRYADAKILGYVHTSYGKRDFDAVRSDIQGYFELYDVDGFFLDEMSTDPSTTGYYARIRKLIKQTDRSLEIVGNPGVIASESFVKTRLADAFVMFEGPFERFSLFRPPGWVRSYPSSKFAAIIYDTPSEDAMRQALDRCIQGHIGSLFISDGKGTNPYGQLPGYWSEKVAAIGALQSPPRVDIPTSSGDITR